MCEPRCRSNPVCPVCASVCQCNEPTTVPHLYSHDHVKDFSLDCFLLLVMVQRFFFSFFFLLACADTASTKDSKSVLLFLRVSFL